MENLRVVSERELSFDTPAEAGKALAQELQPLRDENPLVVGLPDARQWLARALAEELDADYDVVLAERIGAPDMYKLVIGTVNEDQEVFLRKAIAGSAGAGERYLETETVRAKAEVERLREKHRPETPRTPVTGRVVILADEGVPDDGSVETGIHALQSQKPKKLIVALAKGAERPLQKLAMHADELVALSCPGHMGSGA